MRKIFGKNLAMTMMLGLLTLVIIPASFATPPVSISLSYDASKGVLHVEAVHPSFNLEKSYVRLMEVYVNGQEVSTSNYYRQKDYNEFIDDVPLTAQAGDVIKVDLFCSLGGEMAKELIVQSAGAGTGNSTTDNKADNVTYNTAY